MTDTIDLLESIGKNASLRHAAARDLDRALEHMNASESLRRAAATLDPRDLRAELCPHQYKAVQNPPEPSPGPPPQGTNLMPPPPPMEK